MAKGAGHVRLNKVSSTSESRIVFQMQMQMPNVDASKSYFSEKSGGYVVFDKGHNFQIEEAEVAKSFADNGFIVEMTPEGNKMYATNKLTKKGKEIYKYSEGRIDGFSFEQRTITEVKNSGANSVKYAIQHTKEKNSDIAVIYDRNGLLHREDIQNGITEYEKHKTNTYRAKAIIVVDKNGRIYFWGHNK